MSFIIRPAAAADLDAVARIYTHIHDREEAGLSATGWVRGDYPTPQTAQQALAQDQLYVLEQAGTVCAAAIINQRQGEEYAGANWQHAALPQQVLVLHTLVVEPSCAGQGYGAALVDFYQRCAVERGCAFLRLDTNVTNAAARRLYARLGFSEVGTARCEFNGIPAVELVFLEKAL